MKVLERTSNEAGSFGHTIGDAGRAIALRVRELEADLQSLRMALNAVTAAQTSPVQNKGVEDSPHGTNCLMAWLDETGYKRVTIRSDQEPTIKAVVNAAKAGWHGKLIPDSAPKENHEKSNGAAEITVQQAHGIARTLKEACEDQAKISIPAKHPALTWLLEYGAFLY